MKCIIGIPNLTYLHKNRIRLVQKDRDMILVYVYASNHSERDFVLV